MPTIEKFLDESSENNDATAADPICEIDADTRVITIPDEYRTFGVESDEKAMRIPFRCAKIVGDGIDLTKLNLYINYSNANDYLHVYSIDDVAVDGDYITFSWLLSRNVTEYPGTVFFVVCAKATNDGEIITEWNTRIASGVVENGLEATETIERSYSDVIDQIISVINSLNKRVATLENAVFDDTLSSGNLSDQ